MKDEKREGIDLRLWSVNMFDYFLFEVKWREEGKIWTDIFLALSFELIFEMNQVEDDDGDVREQVDGDGDGEGLHTK